MRQLVTSKFLIAVIIFGALSFAAGQLKLFAAAADDFSYRSWTAWAIDDFLHQKVHPKVVFMGSSLVLVPLAGVDADYLKQKLDGSEHHNSVYFEKRFAQKTGVATPTFNFALPGEMPSDAYMITSFLLKGERRPDVIVYGVGPRDFMDNLLPGPSATDPYRFLSRFGDVSSWAPLMMPDWVDRLNYEGGRVVYLYGHKEDIANKLVAMVSAEFVNQAPSLFAAAPMKNEIRHELLPGYQPFALQHGEAFFRPSTAEDRKNFVDNIGEYKKRYKTLKRQTFDTQLRFFTETLAAARQQGSRVIVMAMPITDINRQLLSDANWNLYRTSIKTIADSQDATFVDFNEDNDFVRSDFGDTVHLHSGGGRMLLDKLVDRLSKDKTVFASLGPQTGGMYAAKSQTSNFGDDQAPQTNRTGGIYAAQERSQTAASGSSIARKGGVL